MCRVRAHAAGDRCHAAFCREGRHARRLAEAKCWPRWAKGGYDSSRTKTKRRVTPERGGTSDPSSFTKPLANPIPERIAADASSPTEPENDLSINDGQGRFIRPFIDTLTFDVRHDLTHSCFARDRRGRQSAPQRAGGRRVVAQLLRDDQGGPSPPGGNVDRNDQRLVRSERVRQRR